MLIESRRILALMGDQKVTIAAFLALVIYGAALLIRRDARRVRVRAVLILGIAALWLAVVLFGAIRGDLAQWSSLAVFLFAIGIEGGTTSRVARSRSRTSWLVARPRAIRERPPVPSQPADQDHRSGASMFPPESVVSSPQAN